ncbi:MAG TPA: hypothetical protein VF377_09925 [Acidimicrobiia bacterium]
MPSLSEPPTTTARRLALAALFAVVLSAGPALPAGAATRSVSDVVLVDSGSVISDDLYAAGNRVVIAGRVDGDLVVAAYEDVTITGTVTGDVMGVAGKVIVTGNVGESLRVVSPEVRVSGRVGDDVLAAAWSTTVEGEVVGEATLWAWVAEITGTISGDLEGQMRTLRLHGRVDDNVDVTVRRLFVSPDTSVGSDLGYRSPRPAVGIQEAEVGGAVVHRLPLAPNIRLRALVLLAKLVLGLLAAIAGLLVIWALPGPASRAIARVRESWWKAWLRGISVLALPLLLVALALVLLRIAPVEAALPLLGVLVPLFIALLGWVLMLGFVAPAAVFPWLGKIGHPRRGPVRAFIYAAIFVILASLLPWVSWLVVFGLFPVGIGGWVAWPTGDGTPTEGAPVLAEA